MNKSLPINSSWCFWLSCKMNIARMVAIVTLSKKICSQEGRQFVGKFRKLWNLEDKRYDIEELLPENRTSPAKVLFFQAIRCFLAHNYDSTPICYTQLPVDFHIHIFPSAFLFGTFKILLFSILWFNNAFLFLVLYNLKIFIEQPAPNIYY